MKTMTITVDPVAVPAAAVCRIYHADNNEYLGETVSDGSGVLVFEVKDEMLQEVQVEAMIAGVDGTQWPAVLSLEIA